MRATWWSGNDRVFANPPADAEAIRALHARALAGE